MCRHPFVGLPLAILAESPVQANGTTVVNIAHNRAAYQSGSADDDHTAHLATDGSTETYWESGTNHNSWIDVDLGKACSLSRITLHWKQFYATAYRIQISNDGLHPANWKDIYTTAAVARRKPEHLH